MFPFTEGVRDLLRVHNGANFARSFVLISHLPENGSNYLVLSTFESIALRAFGDS